LRKSKKTLRAPTAAKDNVGGEMSDPIQALVPSTGRSGFAISQPEEEMNTSNGIAELAPAIATEERRRAPRRQPALGTVLRLDAARDQEPRLGLVWNISASGLSLLLHEPVERGAALRGSLATADDAPFLPVEVRVAHVKRLRTGDYVLGGQFERPLLPDEIQRFVGPLSIAM
jgi:hypothetical protein